MIEDPLYKPIALVIDDNDPSAEVLRRFLVAQGLAVVTSVSGEDALLVAAKHPFALIMLDIQMYSMNGWQFLKELHGRGLQPGVPVVVVSGRPIEDDMVKERHVVAALQKPIHLDELKIILANLNLLRIPRAAAG